MRKIGRGHGIWESDERCSFLCVNSAGKFPKDVFSQPVQPVNR